MVLRTTVEGDVCKPEGAASEDLEQKAVIARILEQRMKARLSIATSYRIFSWEVRGKSAVICMEGS